MVSCLRKVAKSHQIAIIASIHQPNSDVLAKIDQLYVLARGGVCVYSGPPSKIRSNLSKIPDITNSIVPIETLIKHSCSGHEDPIVRQLVRNANTQWELESTRLQLNTETQPVTDGVQKNRQRFSIRYFYVLLLRYLTFWLTNLWKEWLFFAAVYILYSCVLHLYWDSNIAFVAGCLNPEDDFNNTCTQTPEKALEEKQLNDNVKFTFFMSDAFILLTIMHGTFMFYKEIDYFINEHRNGMYLNSYN